MIDLNERIFIDRVRGLSILRVVLAHLGLAWFYTPYSQFITVFLPVLFFVSGAVSFSSFSRAKSNAIYLKNRLLSLVLPVYIVVFVSFIVLGAYSGKWLLSPDVVIDWLQLVPSEKIMPFPLGQVWFIHTLFFVVLASIPVFIIAQVNRSVLLLIILGSLTLSVIQLITPVGNKFFIEGHNLYKPLVHLGFFMFGAYWVINKAKITFKLNIILLLMCLLAAVALIKLFDLTLIISDHVFYPDAYYVLLSYSAIFLVLILRPWITGFFNYFKLADKFILYFSRHAYSIFILHSMFVYISEVTFGLVNVMSSPMLAIIKIGFVISASCICAYPVTFFTNSITGFFKKHTASSVFRFFSNGRTSKT